MRLTDIPSHAPGVVSRLVDDEAVIVHPGQGMVRALNEVGSRLWELADGQRSVADLAAALAAEYAVDLPCAQADALAFCEDLAARGVMRVRGVGD